MDSANSYAAAVFRAAPRRNLNSTHDAPQDVQEQTETTHTHGYKIIKPHPHETNVHDAPHADAQHQHAPQQTPPPPHQNQAEALADELPKWLLDSLQLKGGHVHALFSRWRLDNTSVVPAHRFARALHEAAGLDLSADETAELERIVRSHSEPWSHATNTERYGPGGGGIDVRLLSRALASYETTLHRASPSSVSSKASVAQSAEKKHGPTSPTYEVTVNCGRFDVSRAAANS